jgi:hypothetical protein
MARRYNSMVGLGQGRKDSTRWSIASGRNIYDLAMVSQGKIVQFVRRSHPTHNSKQLMVAMNQ